MLRSLLVHTFLTFGIPDHFVYPRWIHSLPVDFVPVLLEEGSQGSIFDAMIAA
jgi:hypothetical protein